MLSYQDVLLYNPYIQGAHLEQFKSDRVFVVSDYDRTQTTGTGEEEPSAQELKDRSDAFSIGKEMNAVMAAISARSPALAMSEKMYRASVANGYSEPPPRWYKNPATGKYEYIDPAQVPFFRHNVDWHLIGSFGWGILVQNGKGYRIDKAYEQMLSRSVYEGSISSGGVIKPSGVFGNNNLVDIRTPLQESEYPSSWKIAVMAFIADYCEFAITHLTPIEHRSNYLSGKTNVAPLPFRMQFNFVGPKGYRKMLRLRKVIREEKQKGNPFACRIQMVDESRISEEDPDKSRYTLYLVPWHGRKENIFNRMLSQNAEAAGLKVEDVRLFYFGDSPTDLKIGLWGGGDAQTKFLLPTGSDLAPYLIGRRQKYGAVDLSFLWENPLAKRAKPRLVPTGKLGEYRFEHKILGSARFNTVVIGDERYGKMTPPGSVAAFLEEYLKNGRAGHS